MTTTRTTAPQASVGLLTDRYELTMLASFIREGIVDKPAVFECFARRLPAGRRYGMLAGLGRLLPLIEDFRFDAAEVRWLEEEAVIDAATASYLRDFHFSGDVTGLREGDLYFPGTPVLTVEATLGEGVLLETLVLSVLNHDTAIASAAARMVTAAADRPLIEMGSRRTHEASAIAVARAAYIAGFASTSNLAAGYLYAVPTVGTAAHAFTLAHESEMDAFRSQVTTHGAGTTLLVDTYDTQQGIRNAVAATREVHPDANGPGAVRLDSGDLAEEARAARALLDSLGATDTRITVTSDLDEYVITALADAPIDGYGAGTRVATGSGHPTAGMVYKLVSIEGRDGEMRPVAKKASGKGSVGGRKTVWRTFDDHGTMAREIHAVDNVAVHAETGEETMHVAQLPLMRDGRTVHAPPLTTVRTHAAGSLARLPLVAHDVSDGEPVIVPTTVLPTRTPAAATALQEA
ncbi:nicotinate phosphoribosyltransferase [Nocardioides sp.]|uniref:nicotinate phosphoribosyltransferase n=1 Tax=Nocardioides sp. TaxID=35761 RepID=UPI002C673DC6|nr:nicotinate phosphoribosyltransferase [Nocardioides sp.]HXH80945.1 nicotinate phosphoribosyltransferase [Nocardioides sp.]